MSIPGRAPRGISTVTSKEKKILKNEERKKTKPRTHQSKQQSTHTSWIILRHRRLVNSEKGSRLIIEFRFHRWSRCLWGANELPAFLIFTSSNTKMPVNALAKSEQVKTFCVKEYYLDSKNSLYATLTQIGFNEFLCACTLADNGFPHDSDQNKYGAWWQCPGSEMSAASLQLRPTVQSVIFPAMTPCYNKLFCTTLLVTIVHKR